VQRGSIELCLKKQKPYANMLVCHDLSGKMLLKPHYTSIIDNPCIVINGRHPLSNSMETNLMFHIKVFGTCAYVWIPSEQRQDKLSPKSEVMIFIGYESNTKGYRFWSKERRRVFISMNAIFDEKDFPYCSRNKEDGPTPIPVEDDNLFSTLDDLPTEDT
jgi:hypothetical protein